MKDHNAPKRPLSGYFRYSQSIRAEVQERTGLNGIKVTPYLTQAWNELSDAEKAKYNNQAAKEMKKWKKKFEAYKKTKKYAEFQAKKKAKKLRNRKPKDKNAPKRPMSAYILFANDVREDVREELGENASFGQIGSKISSIWNSMDEEEKECYQLAAEKAKEKYQKTLAKYKKSRKFAQYQAELAEFKKMLKEERKAAKQADKKASTKKIIKKKK